jgi:hypothetical protein
MSLLIAFLIGVGSGVVAYLITDANLRPNLKFTVQTGDIAGPLPHTAGLRYRHLHVLVTNQPRGWWWNWRDSTANFARCYVEFKDPASGEVISRIDGRWASVREPFFAGGQLDFATVILPQREILVIGETFPVDVAVKFDGQRQFYAFNNQSYLPADDHLNVPWTHADKRLERDNLHVEVEVVAEGLRARSETFVLRNPNTSLQGFELASL